MQTVPRSERWLTGALAVCVLSILGAAANAEEAKKPASAPPLLTKDLIGVPDKELVMFTVEQLPGGASSPHRHDAQVFVYVVEGSVIMQVEGQPAVTLKAGETFYESPGDIHKQAANASKTEPAKLIVFMVKNKGQPISKPVTGH
jgi:quercetin dioxygenase-like cupin family protein